MFVLLMDRLCDWLNEVLGTEYQLQNLDSFMFINMKAVTTKFQSYINEHQNCLNSSDIQFLPPQKANHTVCPLYMFYNG